MKFQFLWAVWLIASFLGGAAAYATEVKSAGWEVWQATSYTMEAGEVFQFRVDYSDLPLRRWQLIVDGGDRTCDLSVLRLKGEELVYYKTGESRHEVSIPWGRDEELVVVLTHRGRSGSIAAKGDQPAAFLVSLLGEPRDQVLASYSYHANRCLEAFAAGRRLEAMDHCERALASDPQDSEAKVLLAGFLRDDRYFERALALVEEALAADLSSEMQAVAEGLRADMVVLLAPLPPPVKDGVARIEKLLSSSEHEEALAVCEHLLDGSLELDAASRSRLLLLKGRCLDQLGRNFAAVDAFTRALTETREKAAQAVIYCYMGQLFLKMNNAAQAQGAFTIALDQGLPSGLAVRAREGLQQAEKLLQEAR